MNDTVNEINTACINDAVEIVSRLKPIYTLKHARRQQEDLFLYGRGLPVLILKLIGMLKSRKSNIIGTSAKQIEKIFPFFIW